MQFSLYTHHRDKLLSICSLTQWPPPSSRRCNRMLLKTSSLSRIILTTESMRHTARLFSILSCHLDTSLGNPKHLNNNQLSTNTDLAITLVVRNISCLLHLPSLRTSTDRRSSQHNPINLNSFTILSPLLLDSVEEDQVHTTTITFYPLKVKSTSNGR
jgi:hypothetical protein